MSRSDVWDLACFDEVKIIKRWVYSRPALEHGPVPEYTVRPMSAKIQKRGKFKLAGYLAKGVSTHQALIEIWDAYGK